MGKQKTFLKSLKATRRQRVVSGIYGLGVEYEPRKRKTPARVKPRDKPLWHVRPLSLGWAWKKDGGSV